MINFHDVVWFGKITVKPCSTANIRCRPALVLIAGLLCNASTFALGEENQVQQDSADDRTIEEVHILGIRANRTSKGATGLPLSLVETPQSVSVIDRGFIDSFGYDSVNDVLKMTTGVNVEEVETDRTYYNSRGFDIKSMQVDGIGLPFLWNVVGALDTVVYEKVEVIRGANGLLTGTGNPSGTINYVRKRPTNDFQAGAELSAGSWSKKRFEGDIAGPLTDSGAWAGRLVAAAQSGESWLDHYENDRNIIYGVVDGQISRNTTLTFGYTRQDNKSGGVLWGALPLLYSDGSQAEYVVSTSTTMDWTYWDTHSQTGFAELAYALPAGWEFKAVLTRNEYEEPSELFYIYASPGLDRDTGLGLYGYPGKYKAGASSTLLDATISGTFSLGGRQHDLVIGLNLADADSDYRQSAAPADDPAWGAMPAFPGWTGSEVARPDFGKAELAADWNDDIKRLYGAAKLDLADALDIIVGFNAIDVHSDGYNFDELRDRDEQKVSPYIGANWWLTESVNAYASYSDIYEPQAELGEDLAPLGAAMGTSYEAGIKSEFFDRQLLTTVSLFKAKQDNYAEYAGFDAGSGLSYYAGVDVESRGFELEASGRIDENWYLLAGFTQLELETPDGGEARTFVPRKTFNLGTRYEPAILPGLEVGATLRWQDEISYDTGAGVIRQQAYMLVSAYISYDLSDHIELALNANNLADEKYLTSLYWDQSFYGAPRNWSGSVRLTY